jgi:small subunit ribosomal protein S24e
LLADAAQHLNHHGRHSRYPADAQVPPQPSACPEADGRVRLPPTPRDWTRSLTLTDSRDVLHPNRANVSKDELRDRLSDLYKSNKDQVSVFGFRTQYGGGKSTGFALLYDSHEAMKKFEPNHRLVRIGAGTKVEKASRQQRTFRLQRVYIYMCVWCAD